MNQFEGAIVGMLACWIAWASIRLIVSGPQAALAVLLWPVRMLFQLARQGIGNIFIAIGRSIHGGRGHRRRRHP